MDEIIKSTDNRYSEYETLLFLRDKLRKEAYAWKNRYLAEFGNLITAVFEQKIACIKKKKTISARWPSIVENRWIRRNCRTICHRK